MGNQKRTGHWMEKSALANVRCVTKFWWPSMLVTASSSTPSYLPGRAEPTFEIIIYHRLVERKINKHSLLQTTHRMLFIRGHFCSSKRKPAQSQHKKHNDKAIVPCRLPLMNVVDVVCFGHSICDCVVVVSAIAAISEPFSPCCCSSVCGCNLIHRRSFNLALVPAPIAPWVILPLTNAGR